MRIQHYKYTKTIFFFWNKKQVYVKKHQCIAIQLQESGRCRNEPTETQELLQFKCEALALGAVGLFQVGYGEKGGGFKNLYVLVCAISSQKPEIRMNSLRICVE